MKIINIVDKEVIIEILYDDASMIHATLGVPLHAVETPDFEERVGASESTIEEIGDRLYSLIESKGDYDEYHKLVLQGDSKGRTGKYKTNLKLSKNHIFLLSKAFKEACLVTKEFDDFHTMTGYEWSQAMQLQRELEDLVIKITDKK